MARSMLRRELARRRLDLLRLRPEDEPEDVKKLRAEGCEGSSPCLLPAKP